MDREQQVRLNFLEEAETCFDRIEAVLLERSGVGLEPHKLDQALRAAHSVKGGAAMMGFSVLSHVAHQLEDFLKILRVRPVAGPLHLDVETLLLQSVDSLRHVNELHRQGTIFDDDWFIEHVQPIFEQLRHHLGDLKPEDEDALLAQEGIGDNPALLMFEGGVEGALENLETQLNTLDRLQLCQELEATALELAEFGRVADIQTFVDLCQHVQSQLGALAIENVEFFARQALQVWQRAHSMVLLGRVEKIAALAELLPGAAPSPQRIDIPRRGSESGKVAPSEWLPEESSALAHESSSLLDLLNGLDFGDGSENEFGSADVVEIGLAGDWGVETVIDEVEEAIALGDDTEDAFLSSNVNLSPVALSPATLQDVENRAFSEATPKPLIEQNVLELIEPSEDLDFLDPSELLDLQSELADMEEGRFWTQIPERGGPGNQPSSEPLSEAAAAQTVLELERLVPADSSTQGAIARDSSIPDHARPNGFSNGSSGGAQATTFTENTSSASVTPPSAERTGRTVRVPIEYLEQFNTLLGQLVLERNTINLRLGQLKRSSGLLRERLQQLDETNTQLRQWYDHSALERTVPATHDDQSTLPSQGLSAAQRSHPLTTRTTSHSQFGALFDRLEMDRYTDLHSLSQDQMETIVQLQEVTADIDLGLREIGQVARDLDQTTRAMQGNATRTQMRPFSDIVGRFPRVIRDLCVQYGKAVNLKILGEGTLLDRSILDSLGDPLMHLLRNAFDHGIEDSPTRLAAGKSPEGTITIHGIRRGNQVLISVQDDGRGISLQKVRDRACRMGISERLLHSMSSDEILELIFEPGFSTANQVTELSGRGVGMDIVRTSLNELRGTIRVETTPGLGTTFIISVPFTLSFQRVMVVERAGMIMAIPVDGVKEIVQFQSEFSSEDDSTFLWQGTPIPLVRLEQRLAFQRPSRQFEMEGMPTINRPMVLVVTRDDGTAVGLWIDRFWGEQEVNTYPIESLIPLPPGFGGSTLLGNGRVLPVVDPGPLVEWFVEGDRPSPLNALPAEVPSQIAPAETILVVDDSINVRRYLTLMLEKAGYQVEEAKDGQDAVDKLQSGLPVQAIICDIEMPRLDGYGVLTELKSDTVLKDLPVVLLTSRSNDKHRKLAMNLGASAYLSKPCNESQLLQTLEAVVS